MRAKRFISVVLSLLIVCSSFAGLTVFADEITTKTCTEKKTNIELIGATKNLIDTDASNSQEKSGSVSSQSLQPYQIGSTNQIARLGWLPYSSATPPEQSIESYALAYKNGCRIMLCDIQVTSDGEYVCRHDLDFGAQLSTNTVRKADGTKLTDEEKAYKIKDLTLAEIDQYDFGAYKGTQYAGTKILRLADFLAWCGNNNCIPMLEIKVQLTTEQVAEIARLCNKYKLSDRTIVADGYSQIDKTIDAWIEKMPKSIMCLRGGSSNWNKEYNHALTCVNAGMRTCISITNTSALTDERLENVYANGIDLLYSEIKSEREMQSFFENGWVSIFKYITSSYINIPLWISNKYNLVDIPTGKITSTKGVNNMQTAILSLKADAGVSGYYWGNSANYVKNTFTKTSDDYVTKTIVNPGTYYLTVKDLCGNISNTVSITYYKISLETNGAEVYPSYIISASDNSIDLPIPIKNGYIFVGWAKENADTGYFFETITPIADTTYYAIWQSTGVEKQDQSIDCASSAYAKTYGAKPFNLNAKAETALSYASDNTSVAEVSADGTVTIKGAGKATITITAEETANYNSAIATVEITVNKASQKVSVAEKEYELTYGAKPFNLGAKADTTLTYVSNNLNVAEVSTDGTVIIKGAGTANIIIIGEETENYTSAITTVKITVNKASQKVSVAEKEYELTYGAKPFNLGAKADTTLTYVSNNLNVAEVSTDGTVTIKGAGKATITITAEETANYNSATSTVEITVGKASQKVTGFEPKYEVTFSDKPISLNAKAETALSYASDNTSVAEVSADGTVTIKGVGNATITITAEGTENYESASATVEIIVNKSSQEVTGFESKYDVTFGYEPFNLNAKAKTALTYVSNDTSVAKVSADGTVTINGVGKATITITAEETDNYKSATATVEITVNKASKTSQEITGFQPKYEVNIGHSPIYLNASAKTNLSYISDNTSVAEVSEDGLVTINGVGKATITITAEETDNYKSATATVEITVGKASQKVTGFEPKYDVTFGDNPFSLNAKAETALSYASDNTSVAEVSADGTVTIKGAGKATITITAEETTNYKSATATVEVTVGKASQEVTGFESKYDVTFGDNPFSLNAKADTALSYASDNTSVAEVSADGTVTIKGAGKATITITAKETANYKSATATVEITVAKATQRVTGVKTQYVTSAGKSFILKPKAKTKLTYTSSNKNVAVVSSTGKVTVKAGGCAYITVKASENGNYKSAYVKTKIISAPKDFISKDVSKVKKTGKTTAKITWKSLAGATGYTVQLATNKSYKGAKTVKNSKNTANFTNLKKGKTYYVRINAYTKVSGKNYSNKWYTVKFKM
ncbi:MAG: Ig-like domain-containing protein [Ruminococcus sp.]|nr:Ig-like domain-containing protein [Ruminococcus sp.]